MTTIADIVSYIETKGDPQALRFEPATYARLTDGNFTKPHRAILQRIQDIHSCSLYTACMIYSTSFGAFQIMGFNLYGNAIKYNAPIFEYCSAASAQLQTFNAFIVAENLTSYTPQVMAESKSMRETFADIYNGSVDAYTPLIVGALEHYGYVVK